MFAGSANIGIQRRCRAGARTACAAPVCAAPASPSRSPVVERHRVVPSRQLDFLYASRRTSRDAIQRMPSECSVPLPAELTHSADLRASYGWVRPYRKALAYVLGVTAVASSSSTNPAVPVPVTCHPPNAAASIARRCCATQAADRRRPHAPPLPAMGLDKAASGEQPTVVAPTSVHRYARIGHRLWLFLATCRKVSPVSRTELTQRASSLVRSHRDRGAGRGLILRSRSPTATNLPRWGASWRLTRASR